MNKGLFLFHQEPANIERGCLPALPLRKPPFAELNVVCPNTPLGQHCCVNLFPSSGAQWVLYTQSSAQVHHPDTLPDTHPISDDSEATVGFGRDFPMDLRYQQESKYVSQNSFPLQLGNSLSKMELRLGLATG